MHLKDITGFFTLIHIKYPRNVTQELNVWDKDSYVAVDQSYYQTNI